MKHFKLLMSVCAACAIAACGFSLGFTQPLSAHADDAAAVRIDFSDDTLYTTSGTVGIEKNGAHLAASSSVSTKEKFTSFLLYADVTAEGGAIAINFGGNKTLKFTAENEIQTSLIKIGGEREFSFADFKEGGIVSLEVLGSSVTVGVSARVAPEEFLYQPVAVYSAENALGEIKITAEGSDATVQYLNVFSLAGTIEIDPDDWEEGDGEYPVKPAPEGKEENEEKGCAGTVGTTVISTCLAGCAVLVAVILIGRKKHNEK